MDALGPLLGRILVFQLKDLSFSVLGVSMGNLQVVFALSALTRLVPLIILRTLDNAKSTTSRSLLSQMRRGKCAQLRLQRLYLQSRYRLGDSSPRRRGLGPLGKPPRHRTTGPGLSRRQPPRSP